MAEHTSGTTREYDGERATGSPRLTRSVDDRVVAGVCGGIGRHLEIDPVLVRVAFVILALAGGSGVLAYVVAWVLIPEATDDGPRTGAVSGPDPATLRVAMGGLLVLAGLWWLLDQLVPGVARIAWPLSLIVLGVAVITAGARR